MEKEEFMNELVKIVTSKNVELDNEKLEKFYTYMELLLEWNEKINLTAIVKPEEIIVKHFLDSLTIAKHLKNNTSIVDVGTGAGFPGIPLKIFRPDLKIVLLDSLNKRVKFLNEVIEKLKLEGIEAIHSRAEEFGMNEKYREKFDYATSRAVANLATLSEYLLPLVKIDGKAICMKGSEVKEELQCAEKAINVLGGKIEKVDEFFLIDNDIKRNIILIKKIKETPTKFPRKSGMPAKEPILK